MNKGPIFTPTFVDASSWFRVDLRTEHIVVEKWIANMRIFLTEGAVATENVACVQQQAREPSRIAANASQISNLSDNDPNMD